MRKFVIALVAGVMMATGARMAQADCGKCEMGSHVDAKVDKMALVLDLTDKQKAAVKDLAEAKMKKMKPLMEQMEAQSKAAHEEFEAGVKKILTAKQKAKYEKWEDTEKGGEKECSH